MHPSYANRTVHSGVRGDDHDVTVNDRSTGCVDGLHFDTERSLAAVEISARTTEGIVNGGGNGFAARMVVTRGVSIGLCGRGWVRIGVLPFLDGGRDGEGDFAVVSVVAGGW